MIDLKNQLKDETPEAPEDEENTDA